MTEQLLLNCIWTKTKNKVHLCIKHVSENTFSPGDVSKFIDRLQIEGHRVKLAILDYVDTMKPTVDKVYKGGEYESQGYIVQELRSLSRQYKIPILTATQNSKISENLNLALSNQMVGDSYKKVRFSDFIYMCRMDTSKDIFDPAVASCVLLSEHYSGPDQKLIPAILAIKDQLSSELTPFEVKITKSKDAGKDEQTYMLFCKLNLRIYNNLQEYLVDRNLLKVNSDNLSSDISKLFGIALSSVSDDFDETPENIPFASPPIMIDEDDDLAPFVN